MQPGDHYCGIFRSDAEQRQITVDFIRLGMERNEKMLYLVNIQSAEQLKQTLGAAGIDAQALIEEGRLAILQAKEVYLTDGVFQPEKMIEMLGQETAAVLEAGYTALRVTGKMSWALEGDPGCERLIEYESLLNAFYATGDVPPDLSSKRTWSPIPSDRRLDVKKRFRRTDHWLPDGS